MASTVTTAKLSQNLKITQYDFDPDGTSAVDVAWVDMRDFGVFMFSFFRTVGTSDVTVKIYANSASDGSGTDVEVKSWTNAAFGDPDLLGDYAFGECTAEEIAALGSDLRYVSVNLTFATGTDEAVVTYIRGNPRFSYSGLSANNIG
jgi:DUF971 family protein